LIRRLSIIVKILGLAIALGCCTLPAFAQYVLGSPNGTLNSDGWALDSANMSGFLGAITNPAYFGPSGTVHQSISVVDMSTVAPSNLAGLNGFIEPWWNNAQSAPYQSAVISAFLGGMDLWLLEDDSSHNGIGTALGITSSLADGTPSNGSAPFFSGAFGTATNTGTFGNFDQFSAANIVALGGVVVATNTSGQVTIAYWAKGAYAPGSGALVLFSDVDMISNAYQQPYSPSLDANGILALNTTALLVQGAAIPEPGTSALLGLGGVLLLVRGRRRISTRSTRH
jgi:hypothetical protein